MKKYVVMWCLLITATLTLSAQQSEQQIKKEIGQLAASMKTLQCDFVQTKHLKMLNDKMVSRGQMAAMGICYPLYLHLYFKQ